MNDIMVDDTGDKEMFDAQMISNLKKRIAELEGMVVRLHNTHPENIRAMLKWWADMFVLMPRSAFGKSEGGADD